LKDSGSYDNKKIKVLLTLIFLEFSSKKLKMLKTGILTPTIYSFTPLAQ